MRIFSKEKFLKDDWNNKFYYEVITNLYKENNWVNLLDGLSENQIKQLGYSIVEEAMVEI